MSRSSITSHHFERNSEAPIRMAAPSGIFPPGVLSINCVSCGISVVTNTIETPMPASTRKAG